MKNANPSFQVRNTGVDRNLEVVFVIAKRLSGVVAISGVIFIKNELKFK